MKTYTEQEYISMIRAIAWANDWEYVGNKYDDGDLLELLSDLNFNFPLTIQSLQVLNDSYKLAN